MKALIAATFAALLIAAPASYALTYGTATVGTIVRASTKTFSIYTGPKGELGYEIDEVNQAVELPFGLHDIKLNSTRCHESGSAQRTLTKGVAVRGPGVRTRLRVLLLPS